MATLAFKMAEGIHVSVGLEEDPTDEEWEAFIADVGVHVKDMTGLLSVSGGGGPTKPQRAAINRFWAAQPKKVPLAVVTTSKMVKIVVTALSWVMGDRIRGFTDLDEALVFLQVSPEQRAPIVKVVEDLRASLIASRG